MKETRKIGKRLLSAALAAALAVTTMGTQVFASPEEGGTDSAAEVSSRVLSWSWPEGTDATWDEETQTWTLACSYTTEQPLTQETLTQLLPAQITAVVQTEVATSETAEEDTVTEDTVEDTAAEEESGEPASDAAVSEGPTAADSVATPDTASSDEGERTAMKKAAPEDNAENDTDTAATESQTIAENLTLTWDFSGLTFPLQTGEYTLTASLPEAYQLEEGTPAVQLELQVTPPVATTSNEIQTRTIDPNILNQFIVSDVISPSNVTIDLFDYDVQEENQTEGINGDNHLLQFGTTSHGLMLSSINAYTGQYSDNTPGNGGPMNEIVQNRLQDGYPILTAGKRYDDDRKHSTTAQSLAYLFDNSNVTGKKGYYDVKGLLQLNSSTGMMSYDSQQNFAEYDSTDKKFILYNGKAVNGNDSADKQTGQFFPFAKGEDVFNPTYGSGGQVTGITSANVSSINKSLNHYFGMHMQAYFMQPDGGKLSNGNDMTFTFSGDDDVWVFIDGVLIGDVGGIHDRLELSINFATGVVTVKNAASYNSTKVFTSTTIAKMVEKAQAQGSITLQGDTLADRTYHTLDFFYLERGGYNSNLKLQTNLVEIPVSSVIKVDQLGKAIPNVTFDLYEADDSYNIHGDAIATGTTGFDGTLVLSNNGQPINFAQLAQNKQTKFVLKERKTPEGYRSTGDIHLYYEELGEHKQGVLLSDNSWKSGSWAATTMQATIRPGPIETATGETQNVEENLQGKRLFAVILKREKHGNEPTRYDDWYAISGDVLNGWTLSTQAIQQTSDIQESEKNYFTWDPTTKSYTLTFDSLPGDITKYYYMLGKNDKEDTVYTIGYYYVDVNNNIIRLDSESTYIDRQYAINAYVTNIKNYLFVQKVDESGTVIPDGAKFSLYNGNAVGKDPSYENLLTNSSKAYDSITIGEDGHPSLIKESGIGYFPHTKDVLPNGTYYLIETDAPAGYTVNEQVIKVIVDENGVYADAGDPNDGVSTLVGVGSLVDSMAQFGSGTQAGLDRTLADIVAYKKTSTDGSSWGEPVTENPLYLSRDVDAALQYAPSEGATNNAYFESDTGWTAIGSIKQNYDTPVGGTVVTTTNKTNLGEAPYNDPDVLDLFSRTTVVRVADTPIGLTITKAVTGGTVAADVTEVKAQTFQFKVTKLNDSGTDVDTGYEKTVKLVSGTQKETVTFEDGVLDGTKLHISGVGSITLNGLDTGKYRVEEIVSPQAPGNITIDGVVNEWKEVTYTVTTGTGDTPTNGTVDVDGDTGVTVTATNHYVAYKYLTVTKTVDGNMGDKTKGFSFDLNVSTKNDKGTLVPYGEPLKNSQGPTGGNLTAQTDLAATNNLYTFTLKDNGEIKIKIPYQAKVTVTEPAVNGYTTSSRQYVTGKSVPDMSPNHSEQTVDSLNADYTVDFVNECTIQVPTGLHGETRPYAAMVGLAGAAALISIAGWVELRRRKRREQE